MIFNLLKSNAKSTESTIFSVKMAKTSQTPVEQGTSEPITIDYGKHLSDYISSLPHGKIDKKIPNIGATTLEIEDKSRNSIIVFPTMSLAATKAKELGIYYVGSEFQKIQSAKIEDIRNSIEAGQLVKIAAVADSFIKLYDKLKDVFCSHDFFLVFDEIDSFQTESSYRPRLEECLDIYFKFPIEKRCLISATLEGFSDPRLNSEDLTEIEIKNYIKPDLRIIDATRSVLKVAAEEIEAIARTNPDDKLFIAFNSIAGILKIMELLPLELQRESGILCSKQSYKKIRPYPASEIIDGMLKHRITFFTSAFFVGLDIKEKGKSVHTMIVADPSMTTSLISIPRIRQILGRVRQGSKSNNFILRCDQSRIISITAFNKELKSRTEAYEKILNLIDDSFLAADIRDEGVEIKKLMLKTCMIDNVSLLREVNSEVKISNLNVDHLRLRYKGLKSLYYGFRNTRSNLELFFKINQETNNSDLDQSQMISLQKVDDHLADEKKIESLDVLLRHEKDSRRVSGTFDNIQTRIWSLAIPPIDIKKTEKKVQEIIDSGMNVKELNRLLFQVNVYNQDEKSRLWGYLNMHFKVGSSYSAGYIYNNLNEIARALQNDIIKRERTTTVAVQTFKKIFETKRKMNPGTHKFDQLVLNKRCNEFCLVGRCESR